MEWVPPKKRFGRLPEPLAGSDDLPILKSIHKEWKRQLLLQMCRPEQPSVEEGAFHGFTADPRARSGQEKGCFPLTSLETVLILVTLCSDTNQQLSSMSWYMLGVEYVPVVLTRSSHGKEYPVPGRMHVLVGVTLPTQCCGDCQAAWRCMSSRSCPRHRLYMFPLIKSIPYQKLNVLVLVH